MELHRIKLKVFHFIFEQPLSIHVHMPVCYRTLPNHLDQIIGLLLLLVSDLFQHCHRDLLIDLGIFHGAGHGGH